MLALVAPDGHSPLHKELGGYAHPPCMSDIEHGLIVSALFWGQGGDFETLRVLEGDAVAGVGV